MVSKSFSILICLIIVQCRLALSVDERGLADSKPKNVHQSIPLSELVSTFSKLPQNAVEKHFGFMLWAAGFGDHFYSLPVDLSTECRKTARAHWLLSDKLVILEEVFELQKTAVNSTTRDLQNGTELQEHPLELVCRHMEKLYSENSTLGSLFERTKKNVTISPNARHRPPYYHELIKTEDLILKLVEKSNIPEMAKMMAILTFRNLLRQFDRVLPKGWTYYTRTCRAVAKNEKFADSMQKIFERTIRDVIPYITKSERVAIYTSSGDYKKLDPLPSWWVPSTIRILCDYIRENPSLKKEIDDMAVIVNGDANKEDLDFSKLM